MTLTARRSLLYVVIVALAGAVLCVAFTAIASAEDCTAQCCACEPSEAAEPAPPQRIFLPTVQRDMPPMSSESTPLQPVPTVTPDPPVSGDVQ